MRWSSPPFGFLGQPPLGLTYEQVNYPGMTGKKIGRIMVHPLAENFWKQEVNEITIKEMQQWERDVYFAPRGGMGPNRVYVKNPQIRAPAGSGINPPYYGWKLTGFDVDELKKETEELIAHLKFKQPELRISGTSTYSRERFEREISSWPYVENPRGVFIFKEVKKQDYFTYWNISIIIEIFQGTEDKFAWVMEAGPIYNKEQENQIISRAKTIWVKEEGKRVEWERKEIERKRIEEEERRRIEEEEMRAYQAGETLMEDDIPNPGELLNRDYGWDREATNLYVGKEGNDCIAIVVNPDGTGRRIKGALLAYEKVRERGLKYHNATYSPTFMDKVYDFLPW